MRNLHVVAAIIATASACAEPPPKTRVVLQTPYFSPGLTLPESKHTVYGLKIEVQADAKGEGQGKLTFLLDSANYDEYGDFVTGRETDGVDRNRTKAYIPPVEFDCSIEFVKAGSAGRVNQSPIKRSIFKIKGPKITSPLFVATEEPGLTSGRLLVHGKDQRVEHVISLVEMKPSKDNGKAIPCHPGCFPAGTAVRVPGGTKVIERIREGDLVTTLDADGKTSSAKVTSVFVTRNRVLEVRADGARLVMTETQPIALKQAGSARPAS